MRRVVIIGGGITGLAAAHRILERHGELREPFEVTLLEATARVGGVVQTEKRDGFLLERGPDSFLSEKPATLELAKRLDLESHLIETNKNHRRSFIVRKGRLLPVPEGFYLLAPARFWPLVTSGIFSWPGKARMAMDLVLPRRNTNGNSDESLAQFVRRRLGREALERMAQPMIGGIYTADPEKLSLRATMPRFLEMERTHRSLIRAMRKQGRTPAVFRGGSPLVSPGSSPRAAREHEASGARYSLFLSFDHGMQLLTDKLEERISNFKSEPSNLKSDISNFKSETTDSVPSIKMSLRVNTAIESLAQERDTRANNEWPKWKVRTTGNETLAADAVCLALPASGSARLLRGIDDRLASELEGISYASSVTINLAYKREDIPHALEGFGFVVPLIEGRSLIACTFSSVKFAGRAPDGYALLRAFVGGALQPEMLALTEAELISRVRADLNDLLGIERPPRFVELTRWENSMPQYHVGHVDRVKRIRERLASLPHLALAGNAYSGAGIPDCIRSGEDAADEIIDALWVNG
ncbi:MAG: protoporphyrinogen oxidase [Pyrinomonadaceae bacterium]